MKIEKQLTIVFFAQFLIIASLDMSDPYWPLIIQSANQYLTPKQLQYWSAAIYMLPFCITILTTPFWTHLGERAGQKKMLLRAGFALIVTQGLLCVIKQPVMVLAVRSLQGIFAGFSAAAQAWSVTMVESGKRNNAIGRLQAATAIGTIVGPVLGGMIATAADYVAIFSASSIMILFAFLALFVFLQETPVKKIKATDDVSPVTEFLSRDLKYVLSMIVLTQMARWMSSSYFALYVAERLDGNTNTVGMLYSCTAMLMFLSSSRWGQLIDTQSQTNGQSVKKIFIRILLLAAISQLLFAWTRQLPFALIAALIWGVCLSAIALIPFTFIMRYTPPRATGKLIGLGNSASKLGNLLGVGLGAWIQAETNFVCSFLLIGLFYVVISGLVGYWRFESKPVEAISC